MVREKPTTREARKLYDYGNNVTWAGWRRARWMAESRPAADRDTTASHGQASGSPISSFGDAIRDMSTKTAGFQKIGDTSSVEIWGTILPVMISA
jgi:hypothetical protein